MDNISEAVRRVVIKVNSKGKRRRKILCGKGKRLVGTSCKPITGRARQVMRLAQRKRLRTLKRRGAGKKMKTLRLRRMALRKRHAMHIRNPGYQYKRKP